LIQNTLRDHSSWKTVVHDVELKALQMFICNTTQFQCKSNIMCVTTLTLGSRPKQGLAKVWAKNETQESHFMLMGGGMGECENWTSTLPNEHPLWELESQWTTKFSESNFRGQNPLDWGIPYIFGKLLECRYLKWAQMTHLDIWNTSYGQ
jgi:hypothetical protein